MFNIDLSPLSAYLVDIILTILMALASLAAARIAVWIKSKTGVELDQNARDVIERALKGGIGYARQKAIEAKVPPVAVKNQMLADASNYVIKHVPDALTRFGLDKDAVMRLVMSRLGQP